MSEGQQVGLLFTEGNHVNPGVELRGILSIKSPVKKIKVGMSSWLFLTHPLFPSLL
jgi:hypothetical protein